MEFVSRNKYESAVMPGVSFVLNKMTEGRRIKLRLALAAASGKVRDILRQLETETDAGVIADLNMRLSAIVGDEINPAYVRWGLHSMDGLTIDGAPVTSPDSLIDAGPPELYAEVLGKIREVCGLSETEQKNSESPSTSPAPVDGQTNDTSAVPAVATDGTQGATVPNTSPP